MVGTIASSSVSAGLDRDSSIKSAPLRSSCAVMGLGTATHTRPAAFAEAIPLGESSNATASVGATFSTSRTVK